MPMCDFYIPKDALESVAERKLVKSVMELLVDHEMRRIVDLLDDPKAVQASRAKAQSIAWGFVHRTDTYVAGEPITAPFYKFVVSIPQGQIDDVFIPAINRDILIALTEAEAGKWPNPELRLWVFAHEILDGTWGAAGRNLTLKQIVNYVAPGLGKVAVARWNKKHQSDAAALVELAEAHESQSSDANVIKGSADSGAPKPALHLHVFVSPTRAIGRSDKTFSPITSTLIYGDSEAVLVDSQFIKEDVDALGDVIEQTGRRLTTIFITHGHGDHYFGSDRLAARFPGARIVATPDVAEYINSHHGREVKTFAALFGDQVAVQNSVPIALTETFLDLEGHRLPLVEVGQGDIAPTVVLHVPALDAVVAGDVAYNQIHQMLGLSGPAEWQKWIASLDKIEKLKPRIVVAGHKKPTAPDDAAQQILDGTRAYIRDFAEISRTANTIGEIVSEMCKKYPDHGNVTTLLYSANAVVQARARAKAD
jgi:glyoxylase-like metal-dependent hydrolase (beta-lactamase superfamily II)